MAWIEAESHEGNTLELGDLLRIFEDSWYEYGCLGDLHKLRTVCINTDNF
jgi:hypothetical protein